MVNSAPTMRRRAPSDDAILSDSEEFSGPASEGEAAAPLPDPIAWVATTSGDADGGLNATRVEPSGQDGAAAVHIPAPLYDGAAAVHIPAPLYDGAAQ